MTVHVDLTRFLQPLTIDYRICYCSGGALVGRYKDWLKFWKMIVRVYCYRDILATVYCS